MQEHLIPQDISNYQFHLIGELNLKQFGEIMAGVIVGFLINATNWPDFIKWPIIVFVFCIGLIAAFIPIGGQPFSHWVGVFAKGLFAPTKFYWQKTLEVPSYFTYELPAKNKDFLDANSTFNASPAKKHRALAYFTTLEGGKAEDDDPLEIFNEANIAQATSDFNYTSEVEVLPVIAPSSAPKKMVNKPQVDNSQSVRQRQIVTPTQESLDAFLQTNNIFQPSQVTDEITAVDARVAAASDLANISPDLEADKMVGPAQPAPLPPRMALDGRDFSLEQMQAINRGEMAFEAPATPVGAAAVPPPPVLDIPTVDVEPTPPAPAQSATPTFEAGQKSPQLSGMVTDRDHHPLADVIISLRDTNNNPRAIIRSDAFGRFQGSDWLTPGDYYVTPRKDNYLFPETIIRVDEEGVLPLLLISQ